MHQRRLPLVVFALVVAACNGEKQSPSSTASQAPPSASSVQTGTDLMPDPGGKVIAIEMTSDEKGNYFSPTTIEAKAGDVLRYTLKIGVHNVHFLPDSNAGKSGLPPLSDLLQLPGQTYDLKVSFAPGTYYFQCDPHAALGMIGHLKVSK